MVMAISIGFKHQHTTWIRCALYVSVLCASYTDTNKDGTHYMVVGTRSNTLAQFARQAVLTRRQC